MRRPEAFGQQHLHVAAQKFGPRVPEQGLDLGVDVADPAFRIDDQHGVGRRLQQRAERLRVGDGGRRTGARLGQRLDRFFRIVIVHDRHGRVPIATIAIGSAARAAASVGWISVGPAASTVARFGALGGDREDQAERRPVAGLAGDRDGPRVRFDDRAADEQPEAGPFAAGFGGEKGFEQPLLHRCRNAGAVVRDLDDDAARVFVQPDPHAILRQRRRRAGKCLRGVDQQVDQHLGQLTCITQDQRRGFGLEGDVGAAADVTRCQLQRIHDHRAQVDPMGGAGGDMGERAQAAGDVLHAQGPGQGIVGRLAEAIEPGGQANLRASPACWCIGLVLTTRTAHCMRGSA